MNYLSQIETEFSTGRGRSSRLSPMDWHLAQSWWDSGIPLHVVIGAMTDAFNSHAKSGNKRPINSLRYFADAVEEKFENWNTSQIGKSTIFRKTDSDETMQNLQTVINDENIEILRAIADALPNIISPEPLCSAVANLRGELLALADDTAQKQLPSDEIEARLGKLRCEFEPSLIVSLSDDERTEIITRTRAEYDKFKLLPEAEQKVLMRKIYQRFGLPELTLYAL